MKSNNQECDSAVSCWEADEEDFAYSFCHQYFAQENLFDTYTFGSHTTDTNDVCPSPLLPSPPSPTQDSADDLREFYLGGDGPVDSLSTPKSCTKSVQDFEKLKNEQTTNPNDDLAYKISLVNSTRYNNQEMVDYEDILDDLSDQIVKSEEIKDVSTESEDIRNDLLSPIKTPLSPLILSDNDILLDDNHTDHSQYPTSLMVGGISPFFRPDSPGYLTPLTNFLDSPSNFFMDRDDCLIPRYNSINTGYESDGLFEDNSDFSKYNKLNDIIGDSPVNVNTIDFPDVFDEISSDHVNYSIYENNDSLINTEGSNIHSDNIYTEKIVDTENKSDIEDFENQSDGVEPIPIYNDIDEGDNFDIIGPPDEPTKRKRQMKTNYDCRLCGQPRKYHICPYKPRKESEKQLNDRIRRECTEERQRKRVTRTRAGAPLKKYTCKKCGQYKKDELGRSHVCRANNTGTQVDELGIYDKFII